MRFPVHGLVLGGALGFLAGGCVSPSGPLSVSEISDDRDIKARAHEFWFAQAVARSQAEEPRVAIVEFSLQYVGEAGDSTSREAIRRTDFGQGLRLELPSVLYRIFEQTIPEFGGSVVSLAQVSAASGYRELDGRDGSDVVTGALAPSESIWYPTDGLLVIDGTREETAKVMGELLSEVDADVALKVRLRVGVYDGRGAIYPGSSFTVFTENDSGYLESQRTLVSELGVIAEESGEVMLAVASGEFVAALENLFRPYIAMALVVSRE